MVMIMARGFSRGREPGGWNLSVLAETKLWREGRKTSNSSRPQPDRKTSKQAWIEVVDRQSGRQEVRPSPFPFCSPTSPHPTATEGTTKHLHSSLFDSGDGLYLPQEVLPSKFLVKALPSFSDNRSLSPHDRSLHNTLSVSLFPLSEQPFPPPPALQHRALPVPAHYPSLITILTVSSSSASSR